MVEVEVDRPWNAAARRTARVVSDFWSEHPALDLLLAAVLVVAHLLPAWRWPRADIIAVANASHRLIIYGAFATVASLAAGTNNAAVGSYAAAQSQFMDSLRQTKGHVLRKSFRSISVWLWSCTVLCVIAMVIDGDPSTDGGHGVTHGSPWIFEVAFVLAVTKFARLAFLHDLVLKANDQTASSPSTSRQPVRYVGRDQTKAR